MNYNQDYTINHTPLIQEVFRFRMDEQFRLILREYSYGTRPTTRHKFVREKWFDAIDRRRSSIQCQEVEVTDEIIEAVKKQIFDNITYLKP